MRSCARGAGGGCVAEFCPCGPLVTSGHRMVVTGMLAEDAGSRTKRPLTEGGSLGLGPKDLPLSSPQGTAVVIDLEDPCCGDLHGADCRDRGVSALTGSP